MRRGPVAVFDSGIGGLTVLREIRRLLPGEDLCYLADQAHVPYGPRPADEVRALCRGAVRFLLDEGAAVVVVACNTASAAALHHLREVFPRVSFVGMEPAVKPAAQASRSGAVGVLATPGTFRGRPFCSVVERFARGVRVLTATCPGLVDAVEAGETAGPRLRALVEEALAPLLREGIDALVLGCTHYPHALETIREVCGPGVDVIDPAPAVARQVLRVLEGQGWRGPGGAAGRVRLYTSGPAPAFRARLPAVWPEGGEAVPVTWQDGRLVRAIGDGASGRAPASGGQGGEAL
ncbi:MAG: glutamate racemase [Deferrisomatales bacterium]|nr:glutamate racemase [Deferrisomatales bacterium]